MAGASILGSLTIQFQPGPVQDQTVSRFIVESDFAVDPTLRMTAEHSEEFTSRVSDGII